MLKDRRALLENEITKAHDEAATMYLSIVTTNGNVHSKKYHDLKDRIASLTFDLNIVNQLIYQGHE
jgi:hypothetical protein